MAIACIGWGSLIWNPQTLPIIGGWQDDGPPLPVEFARRSQNGLVTLVIVDGAPTVQTLWAPLNVPDLAAAVEALRQRERMPSSNRIGRWPDGAPNSQAKIIAAWAKERGLQGAVWTALPPKWNDEERVPSCDEVLGYLAALTGDTQQQAEEYVRRSPLAVRTPYRAAIEAELDWTPENPATPRP